MVKCGIPEKVLQNAVQMRWPCVNRPPQSKVMTKFLILPILGSLLVFEIKKLIFGIWLPYIQRQLDLSGQRSQK